jgi:hypothetical protein
MGDLGGARKWTVLAGFSLLLSAHPARAASEEERAGARSAATQGETAFNQKRWADALDLFSRAESLVHSSVHLLFKARALAELGQLVKARETYVEITREESTKPSASLTKSQAAAQQELAALEPRLANVTVQVSGPGAADATVTMDGAKVPRALIGLSRPVDPGEHRFQASGSGVESGEAVLAVKEGGSGTVVLQLKPLPGAPEPTPAAAAVVAPPLSGEATPVDTSNKPGNGLRVGSYVAFGVGAVGLALGTVFALSAKSKYDDANALCPSFPCSLTQRQSDQRTQLGKDADSKKTLSLVGFIAGGAGVALGTTLFVLSNNQKNPERAQLESWVGLGALGLRGKF